MQLKAYLAFFDQILSDYLAQLDRFRTAWSAALEKAKQHDDINAVAVEETKLAALEDVIAHFPEVTGA